MQLRDAASLSVPGGPAVTRRGFFAATSAAASANGAAASFQTRWRGSRIWTGPEHWANPLQDWRIDNGEAVAKAGDNRTLHILTHQVGSVAGSLRMSVRVKAPANADKSMSAGFRIGIRGLLDDYRHALVSPVEWIDAVLRGDGRLMLDGVESSGVAAISPAGMVLELRIEDGAVELRCGAAAVTRQIDAKRLRGNLALLATGDGVEWRFADWRGSGTLLSAGADQTFGPILWTQYTVSAGVLKLTALFPPLGAADARTAQLELQRGGLWRRVGQQPIGPMSRTATFRVENWDSAQAVPYRVVYRWQGRNHEWTGTVRAEPRDGGLKLGVFSCDNGYVFPMSRLTANVKKHDPDLLFFAGDQIYEGYGGFGFVREPEDLAMLDYLRKFWQFGWSWRELLRDRPAVVIPDDHDVFQGNIWGQGGRPIPKGREKGFTYGGYVQTAAWVNAIQRTQSAHLPDPVDPAPAGQGITVYFTELRYGGVNFAILEDRKFKTGPESVNGQDVEGAQLLGPRQEAFLRRWAADRTGGAFKVVLSQTIFCKVTTHAGRQLQRAVRDLDCGGWPPSGRRRALEPLRGAGGVLMLHGDQHLGALVRHGLDEWEDGPLAFMVPGTANGFPRAWWPEEEKADGRYLDGLGNRMTVLAVANPDKGSNLLPRARTNPETLAHKKGSGYGIVRFDARTGNVTFETWRYLFDAANPKPEDQFPGFPKTMKLV
ncbi:MAG: hypothetical protein FJW39_26825 [Acidobacteria bacterium]|nr:hypothetical protein [Acidobacteriota bacterium]